MIILVKPKYTTDPILTTALMFQSEVLVCRISYQCPKQPHPEYNNGVILAGKRDVTIMQRCQMKAQVLWVVSGFQRLKLEAIPTGATSVTPLGLSDSSASILCVLLKEDIELHTAINTV